MKCIVVTNSCYMDIAEQLIQQYLYPLYMHRLGMTWRERRDRWTRCLYTVRKQCLTRRRANWAWVRSMSSSFSNRHRFVSTV